MCGRSRRTGAQGRIWAVAPMLKENSAILVDAPRCGRRHRFGGRAGAASRQRTCRSAGQSGNLTLSDRHYLNPQASAADGFNGDWLTGMQHVQQFSVVRTGTGSLDLLAGGSYEQLSLFGVYTAGDADSRYRRNHARWP